MEKDNTKIEMPDENKEEKKVWEKLTISEFIKKITLEHVLMVFSAIIGFVLLGLFIYYVVPFIWLCIKVTLLTMVDESAYHYYNFFKWDLLCFTLVCATSAIFVGLSVAKHKVLSAIGYFALFLSIVEVWKYWYANYELVDAWMGGVCFVLLFLVIPILTYVSRPKNKSTEDNSEENSEDDSKDNDAESASLKD